MKYIYRKTEGKRATTHAEGERERETERERQKRQMRGESEPTC